MLACLVASWPAPLFNRVVLVVVVGDDPVVLLVR